MRTSDYTGQQIYFQSVRQRETDVLSGYDYLWRWDTDWFWCSGAFGLHDPRVRRLWPRRWRRSDVYYRLVGLDARFGIMRRLDARAGRPERERVVQDIEVPVERLPEFLAWFDERVGMRPVWLCPLRLREPDGPGSARTWPSYPLRAGTTYVNVGFWGTVHVGPDASRTARPTARSRRRSTSSAATSRCTPRRSTTARRSTSSTTDTTWPGSSSVTTPGPGSARSTTRR